MKVILIEDIGKLGSAGDTIVVRDGYARNFLIPKNKAKPATDANVRWAEGLKKKKEDALANKKNEAARLAERIANFSCSISVAAGEDEKLFGSVTTQDIASALESNGFQNIDKRDILLDEPIKKLGVYQVEIKLHPEIRANLKVWVVKE